MTETAAAPAPAPVAFDSKATIMEAQTELLHLGAGVLSTVNRSELASIMDTAHKSGGAAAVVPALVGDVSQWVRNPTEAMLLAFGLTLATKLAALADQEANAGPHPAPPLPEVTPIV